MTTIRHDAVEAHGLRAVTEYLDAEGVQYEVVEHRATDTAAAEARVAGVPSRRAAKTVVVRTGTAMIIAVVPASHLVDMEKLARIVGSAHPLRLATEPEMGERFPRTDVGALPPVMGLAAAEVVDERLMEYEQVLCHGGDHRHAIAIAPADLVRLADAKVADIVHDWKPVI